LHAVSAAGNPPVDPDAFDSFEAAGWEEKAAAYERFFAVEFDGLLGVRRQHPPEGLHHDVPVRRERLLRIL
jgi:hypothetical protein